ncbi:MAG TPA: tetraacyldisaccharide 4'-kinase [Rhodospirillales bacterium]|nr:tetraacyldisaccharide 4'-kinase [Rhodospirillales bacterium]
MRAPEFWERRKGGTLSAALSPLGWAYGLGGRARRAATRAWRPPVPVLCVGNAVAGGAGKTPLALDIGKRLRGRSVDAHFLTRGYGAAAAGPLRVDAARHTFADVGDEALLLAEVAPTWVARHRVAGARAAVTAGAGALVMDDGHQNPALAKDVSLLAVDGGYGFGNGCVMPAGPLREPLSDALRRTDAVALMGGDETDATGQIAQIGRRAGTSLPILTAKARPGPEARALASKPVVAFAGIGRPGKFFETLGAAGAKVAAALPFPDHHPYGAGDVAHLENLAEAHGAALVTTAKDAVRLPEALRARVAVLTITLEWENEAAIEAILGTLVSHGR